MRVEMMMGRGCGGEIRCVSTLLRQGPIGDLSDRRLLSRFASRDGDAAEAAFAALVERHGAMVLRTCRSILRDGHDAHDAFQATFLVLARRAGSAWSGDSVAAWLHQVARRTALCARSASARRRKHEARAAALSPASSADPPPDDLGEALHAEIARLPDRFRAAVVLCLLEGYTHDQAARHLDVPVGTLQSRLSRGRARLRSQLNRRGLAPSIAPSALMVPPSWIDLAAHAATRFAAGPLPAGVVSASALSLCKEVGNAMMTAKLKLIAAAVLGLGLGVSGVAALAQQQQGAPPEAVNRPESQPSPATRPVPAPDPSAILTPPLEGYERITIQYERMDGSRRVSYVQVVTSELDASGTVRIDSAERSGDNWRHNKIQGKSGFIQITADQASDHFVIKLAANDSPWAIPRQDRSMTAEPPGEARNKAFFDLAVRADEGPAPGGPPKTGPARLEPSPAPVGSGPRNDARVPGPVEFNPGRTLPEEPAKDDGPMPRAEEGRARPLAPISSDFAFDPATSLRAELDRRRRSARKEWSPPAPAPSRPVGLTNSGTDPASDSATPTQPGSNGTRPPASGGQPAPAPETPLDPAPSGVDASPEPVLPPQRSRPGAALDSGPADDGPSPARVSLPPPNFAGIDRPQPRDNPIVLQPGGVDLTPIAPGGEADDANAPLGPTTGKAPEGMEWVRETIAPGKTLERLVPKRSSAPGRRVEGDHAFPFVPQGAEYQPTSGADRRMDELERKLDLILQRLDAPK